MPNPDRPQLNPHLREFWLRRARNRVLYGGRMSSKSWDAAGVALVLAQELSIRVMCTRHFQNRIDESVYPLLKAQIDRFGLSKQFAVYKNRIECPETGSEFFFFGRARNIAEIKGTHGVDIHWAEECEMLTREQWRQIDPTLRGDGSQHWLIFNPQYLTDFVYRNFVTDPPADTAVRKINYDENPFLSGTALKLIADSKERDEEDYRHVYLGEPLTDEERAVIKRSWILAAVDAHIKLELDFAQGRSAIGFDVADDGSDQCAQVHSKGSLVGWSDMWKGLEDELLKSCAKVWSEARARNAEITYDSIGVGAFAGSKFNELNEQIDDRRSRVRHEKFNAGGAVHKPEQKYSEHVKNKDMFSNVKAQAWWQLADRFRNTWDAVTNGARYEVDEMISLDADCPNLMRLIDELSTPKRDFDKNGRVKVESKEDLLKRDVPSPNLADALVMCFAPRTAQMVVSEAAVRSLAMGNPVAFANKAQQIVGKGRSIRVPSGTVDALKQMGRTKNR